MSNPIVPHLAKILTSDGLRDFKRKRAEKKRHSKSQPHIISVYLRLDDPFSYCLIQVLNSLQQRYGIEFDFRTVKNLPEAMYPAPTLWQKNAWRDGRYLANLYDLDFPEQQPNASPELLEQATAQLLHSELQPGYLASAEKIFHAYWQGGGSSLEAMISPVIAANVECYRHHLAANEQQLAANGHYLSAMLHYAGEWYWGIDRLEHLERRLNALDSVVKHDRVDSVYFDRAHRDFCAAIDAPASKKSSFCIELFCSLRSPYSYLAMVRAIRLAEHYDVELKLKPVLPMVMRRMQVPPDKSGYIIHDAKREANKHGIGFGFVADPLGAGVERCYALYEFAESAGKGLQFLAAAARGAWAEGTRLDTDPGLKKVVTAVGLNWEQARLHLTDDSWRIWAQQNLLELYGHGVWGVPSFVCDDLVVFGQDRIDCVERLLRGNHTV